MLIIEGADHLGKTTAAKAIVQMAAEDGKYPIRYCHMSRPNKAFDFFNDYTDMMSRYAVQDRFHLGFLVWHEGVMTPARLAIIEGRLAALGSITLIFYTSDEDWYRARLESQEKAEMFPIDKIIEANRKYAKSLFWNGPYVHIDIKNGIYPDQTYFSYLLSEWYKRLDLLD